MNTKLMQTEPARGFPPRSGPKVDAACFVALMAATEMYLDMMHDCDTSRFDNVFYKTAQLHGYRDGRMVCWPNKVYRDILDKRQSPKSLGEARDDEILLVDFASSTQAVVKVRVRIVEKVFVDHLTWHHIDGDWLITSKAFHIETDGVR